MDMEQYPNAQYHLNQAIAINPAYDKAKQLQSVIAYKTNPPTPTPTTTTTTVATATNTQPKANTATTPAKTTISKKEIATQYNKGVAAQRAGDNVAAAQEFVKAIALDNTNPTFYYSAGLSYFNMKKYDDAIQYLEQAVARKNNYADAFRLLGHIYMDTRKTKKPKPTIAKHSIVVCAPIHFAPNLPLHASKTKTT
jgi:tetratricopeptide (TPR) repeat protein